MNNPLNPLLAMSSLESCRLCPRNCGVDRFAGPSGYCKCGHQMNVSSVCVHQGEEPAISGALGVCNVFFSHCNLQCRFCQNIQISDNTIPAGGPLQDLDTVVEAIAAILDLGVPTLGFVSPSHVIPHMVRIIQAVKKRGFHPACIMNTNAYDNVETLKALDGYIDVYLPDFKYSDNRLALRYSRVENYCDIAARALVEMFRQKGNKVRMDDSGLMRQGIIVRHLVLPGQVENSVNCLKLIAEKLSPRIHLSLMSQYTPIAGVREEANLGRLLRPDEYYPIVELLDTLGMENGWVQSLDSANHYQPDFEQTHPFESKPEQD